MGSKTTLSSIQTAPTGPTIVVRQPGTDTTRSATLPKQGARSMDNAYGPTDGSAVAHVDVTRIISSRIYDQRVINTNQYLSSLTVAPRRERIERKKVKRKKETRSPRHTQRRKR